MINLRYHIVSLVAVFLALAIGITMGSTVISKGLVADLRNRVSRAETGIKNTNHDNGLLRGQLDSLRNADNLATQKLVPELVAGKLTSVPVVVLATPDVDQRYRQQAVTTLQEAGATVEGTVTFDQRLAGITADSNNLKKLGDLVSTDPESKAVTDPVRLWQSVADLLGAELRKATQPAAAAPPPTTAPPVPTTGTPTTAAPSATPSAPAFLTALRQGGFLAVQSQVSGVSDDLVLSGAGYRLVVLGEPAVAPAGGASVGFDAQFVVPLLRAIVKGGPAPLVVGSVADPSLAKADSADAVRDWFVGPIRSDKALDGQLSTVNDLELSIGQVALVLSVQQVGTNKFGHYGTGTGVSALAPGSS